MARKIDDAKSETDARHESLAPGGQPVEDQRAEIGRIVRRLEAIVTTHLEGARRVQHPLTLAQVIMVIDALRAEAEGGNRPVAFSDGEIAFYLMDSLYEELLGEPSNIFYATPVSAEVTRYVPLRKDFWLKCLAALRLRLEQLCAKAPRISHAAARRETDP